MSLAVLEAVLFAMMLCGDAQVVYHVRVDVVILSFCVDSILRAAALANGSSVHHSAVASAALAEQCVVVCGADSSLGIALVQMLARLPNTRVIVSVAVIDDAIARLHERLTALALNVVFVHAEVSARLVTSLQVAAVEHCSFHGHGCAVCSSRNQGVDR